MGCSGSREGSREGVRYLRSGMSSSSSSLNSAVMSVRLLLSFKWLAVGSLDIISFWLLLFEPGSSFMAAKHQRNQ